MKQWILARSLDYKMVYSLRLYFFMGCVSHLLLVSKIKLDLILVIDINVLLNISSVPRV